MIITAEGVGMAFSIASIFVAVMFLHYLLWAGKRVDALCVAALIAVNIGLRSSEHAAKARGENLLMLALSGVALIVVAIVAWREGFRRLRNEA